FKDTSLANQRPDFNSFMKKGDERLRMLEQTDRMPDLQSDFTNSQYKMVYRKSKALTGGLRPDQISPQKLRELLEELERLGRKGAISARVRDSCPATAGAARPRAKRPSVCAPIPSTSASRGSRARAARKARTRT